MATSMFNGKPRIFGKPGDRRVILDDVANIAAVVELLCERHAAGELLHLTVGRIQNSDLAFLRDLPFLRNLILNRCHGSNLTNLGACPELRHLFLSDDYGAFDFSALPLLEWLQVDEWSKKLQGWKSLSRLRLLDARKVRVRSLADFPVPGGVRNLRLMSTSLETLSGLESLASLRSLSLGYSPKLSALSPIDQLPSLRRVQLSHLKRADYSTLSRCSVLLEIEIEACAPLPSLSWVKGLRDLRTFILMGTDVEDGDLSPLAEHEHLLWVGLPEKRHFLPPASEVMSVFEQRCRAQGFATQSDAARLGLLPEGVGILEADWAEL